MNNVRYLGIDPGFDGCLAVVESVDGADVVQFYDAPTVCVRKGKRDYLLAEMAGPLQVFALQRKEHPLVVIVEKVGAFPGQGVTSMFSFGRGLGIWLGMLAALGIPYTEVHPVTWKKLMMADMPKEKESALVRASQLFPECAHELKLKKHIGRADALLMAEYGRRTANGGHK